MTDKRDFAKVGRTASIRYRGKIKGEEQIIDERQSEIPFEVVLGANSVPRAIEDALYQMEIGEVRIVEVPPELGFGLYDDRAVGWYLRTLFKSGYDLEVGAVIPWTNPDDHKTISGRVIEKTQDMVRIDLNHPFAGKTLEYQIELVSLG